MTLLCPETYVEYLPTLYAYKNTQTKAGTQTKGGRIIKKKEEKNLTGNIF